MKKLLVVLAFLAIAACFVFGYTLVTRRTPPSAGKPQAGTPQPQTKPAQGTQAQTQPVQTPPARTQQTQTAPDGDPIKLLISSMTLDEKLGQMIIAGINGLVPGNEARSLVEDYKVGGIIIYGSNVKSAPQLLDLINDLKGCNTRNSIPLFFSVDQEGGRIDRMPADFERYPTNQAIGRINDGNFSYDVGKTLAGEIKAFGFNMDFAPVLDINSNPHNPVIGDRSFGADEETVSRLGVQTMRGLQDGGVIPVVKHFPGHGDTSVDSHIGLPVVEYGMDRLNSFELVPFSQAVKNGADAVMVAHILMKKIDPGYPASLSNKVITVVLRKQLGFEGVVITDDLTMGAILSKYEIGDAAAASVNAGSDILLVAHDYNNVLKVLSSLKKAAKEGTVPEGRLDESVYRILKLKQKYGIEDSTIASVDVNKINGAISAVLKGHIKQQR